MLAHYHEQGLLGTTPSVHLAYRGASASVDYDPAVATPEAIANAVRGLGFEVPA